MCAKLSDTEQDTPACPSFSTPVKPSGTRQDSRQAAATLLLQRPMSVPGHCQCPRLAVFQAAPMFHLKFVPLEIRGWNEATTKVHNEA